VEEGTVEKGALAPTTGAAAGYVRQVETAGRVESPANRLTSGWDPRMSANAEAMRLSASGVPSGVVEGTEALEGERRSSSSVTGAGGFETPRGNSPYDLHQDLH